MKTLIQKISNQNFAFTWNDIFHNTEVRLTLPNLHETSCSLSGDWGPMYAFKLDKQHYVAISYNNHQYKIDSNELYIESPMNHLERQQFPFYIKVKDNVKNLMLQLAVDHMGRLSKVKIVRDSDKAVLLNENVEAELPELAVG